MGKQAYRIGGEESRFGGMIANFSHISMHRILIEDLRCMSSGVPAKMIDMRKVCFNPSVGCFGSDASQSINQQQQGNNKYDDDEVTYWNDVESCVDFNTGGVGLLTPLVGSVEEAMLSLVLMTTGAVSVC